MGTDSQAKYQRLAAEYAKVCNFHLCISVCAQRNGIQHNFLCDFLLMFQIRSQVGVLRKAVIDEQAKNSSLQVF